MIRKYAPACFLAVLGFLVVSPSSRAQEPNKAQEGNKPMVFEGTVGGWRIIEEGQPPVMIHATAEEMKRFREANPHARPGQVQAASTANDLTYHGGIGGIGVETAPKVFLVLWGSQWNNNDPSGEAGILESFYRGIGGSSWANSVTQYCRAAQYFATAQAPRPVIRQAFSRESLLTAGASHRHIPASRSSRPRPFAPRSTSAILRAPGMRAYST